MELPAPVVPVRARRLITAIAANIRMIVKMTEIVTTTVRFIFKRPSN